VKICLINHHRRRHCYHHHRHSHCHRHCHRHRQHNTNNWGETPTKTDLVDLRNQLKEYRYFANLKGDNSKKKKKEKKLHFDKCWAKLESGIQCKRKHKNESNFCKEHMNNCAFGTISNTMDGSSTNTNTNYANNVNIQTYTFYIHNIDGIQYFTDTELNMYSTESVLSDNMPPQKIGTINDANEIIRC